MHSGSRTGHRNTFHRSMDEQYEYGASATFGTLSSAHRRYRGHGPARAIVYTGFLREGQDPAHQQQDPVSRSVLRRRIIPSDGSRWPGRARPIGLGADGERSHQEDRKPRGGVPGGRGGGVEEALSSGAALVGNLYSASPPTGSCAHMMKRISLLMALALMVVAAIALSGVAQAASSPTPGRPRPRASAENRGATTQTRRRGAGSAASWWTPRVPFSKPRSAAPRCPAGTGLGSYWGRRGAGSLA